MKKVYPFCATILQTFIAFTVLVFPQIDSNVDLSTVESILQVLVSDQERLGLSFQVTPLSDNQGAVDIIKTVTAGFPKIHNPDNFKIISYNFLQPPKIYLMGNHIDSSYNSNNMPVEAKYQQDLDESAFLKRYG
ncbi:MAG: hypothetical protein ACKO7Y_05390 [Candidatus Nitrosotenuis sp.]